jgi:hypothetical protein
MAETDPADADPEVVRRVAYDFVWTADKPFPLTPPEAWCLLQGWEVRPAAGITLQQVLDMPGKIEGGDGWIRLWQA